VKFNQRPAFSLIVAASTVAGSLVFAPLAGAAQSSTSTLKTPGHSATSTLTARVINAPFTIRLEDQLLASLRYLPVSFKPYVKRKLTPTTTTSTTTTTTTTTTTPSSTSTTVAPTTTTTKVPTTTTTVKRRPRPPRVAPTVKIERGNFVWRFSAIGALKSQWRVGADNVILHGALMHFQSVNGLPTTGNMDTPTWQTLLSAALKHQYNPAPYDYVVVSQSLPQHLDLYVNGKHTYTSLVNTGISVAPTSNGTYPVYLRYLTTTMSGTNPNGTKYHDTGIPWTSYFHGGDALHGFIRSSYGSPQSLGCVEMPFTNAGKVFPFTPIGTLVTVK
jgi:hypothetical protein